MGRESLHSLSFIFAEGLTISRQFPTILAYKIKPQESIFLKFSNLYQEKANKKLDNHTFLCYNLRVWKNFRIKSNRGIAKR